MSVFIIAEIGLNHNGDVAIARKLIDIAAFSGCDAVKFQKRTPEICVPEAQKNVMRDTPWGLMTYLDYRYRVEFGKNEYDIIDKYCRSKGIQWFASPWDTESQQFLQSYDVQHYKIPSAKITDVALLEAVAATRRHTFISTGMSTMQEIEAAVTVFRKHACPLELMHCVSTYPMDNKEANISCIQTLREVFKCRVGYSGHERGLQITIAAVALGATSVERHVTLDRSMWGSDHAASLEPGGLLRLVRDIRVIEEAVGDGVKRVLQSEVPIRTKLRGDQPVQGDVVVVEDQEVAEKRA
jgi:N-acetylneuraminate synthase